MKTLSILKRTAYSVSLLIALCVVQVKAQIMTRQDKLLIQRGIQFQSWTPNDHNEGNTPVPARQPLPIGRTGRYVRIQLANSEALSIAEVQVYSGGTNVALNKSTLQSSNNSATAGLSALAVDGNINGVYTNGSVTCTREDFQNLEPYWQVDLGTAVNIDSIVIYTRTDACCIWKFKGFFLLVSNNAFASASLNNALNESGVSYYTEPMKGFNRQTTAVELTNANITPTYYQVPTFNYSIHQQNPSIHWGIAQIGKRLPPLTGIRPPSANEQTNGFLNSMQTSKINNLTTLCVGDEEGFSSTNTANIKQWFDIAKVKYPNVLLHGNQYAGQWSAGQIRSFMQNAQPDMITFDMYYYHYVFGPGPNAGNTYTRMYQDMQIYRNLALEGNDGTLNSPIAFGGYLQAFAGDNPSFPGYKVSESEFNLNAYLYLTMGAKWVSEWLYKGFSWDYSAQQLTPQYYQVAKIGKEVAKLSPHLSRLRTYDLRFIPGQNSGGVNVSPNNILAWNNTADPYVKNITATNLGTYNGGLKGDVLIGYFKPVPGLNNTAGITMAPVEKTYTRYFMLLNGLSKPNGCCSTPALDTVQGKANLVRQKIALTIDFGSQPVDTLYRVRRSTGAVEMMQLTALGNGQYSVVDTLDGGLADLFYWKNQGAPAAPPTSGTSLQFSSGTVNGGNVTQLNGASKFTLETWVKFNATTAWSTIFSKYSASTNRIVLSTGPGNSLHLAVNNTDNSYGRTQSNLIATNQWYHIAMVYDGTQASNAERLKLFVDGIPQNLAFYDGSVPATSNSNTAPLRVGSYEPNNPFYLDGNIDEVRVWDTALTPETLLNWNNKTLGACHPNIGNLKLYWPLNDASNPAVATSAQGTTYAGSISNASYVTGGWATNSANCTSAAKAMSFSSGYINTGSATPLNGVSKFTFESWVKFNSTAAWSTVLSKYSAITSRVVLSLGTNNSLRLAVTNGQDCYANTGNNLVTANQWYHMAMVYDGTQSTNAGKLKLFLNGVEQTLTFVGNIPSTSGTNAVAALMAAYSPTNPFFLDGRMDEIRIWNTALSSSTITAWKDKALGSCHPNAANLQVYWPLNDDSSPSVVVAGLGTAYTGNTGSSTYVSDGQATGSSGCSGGLMASTERNSLTLISPETAGATRVYPNPISGNQLLQVDISSESAQEAGIEVFDGLGRSIYRSKRKLEKGINNITLDLSSKPVGLYIIKIDNGSETKQFKVVKN